jgi:hypothetical protein
MIQNPIPKSTRSAYQPVDNVIFPNVVSPNAQGRATPIPVTNMGNTSLPSFNKIAAGKLPSASVIIRSLIRGNSS